MILLFWEKVQLFQLLISYMLIGHEFITELSFLSHDSLVSLSEGVFVKHSPLEFPLSISHRKFAGCFEGEERKLR